MSDKQMVYLCKIWQCTISLHANKEGEKNHGQCVQTPPQKTLIPDFVILDPSFFIIFTCNSSANSTTYKKKKKMYAVSSHFSLTPWEAAVLADHRAPEQNFCICPSLLQPAVNTVFFYHREILFKIVELPYRANLPQDFPQLSNKGSLLSNCFSVVWY